MPEGKIYLLAEEPMQGADWPSWEFGWPVHGCPFSWAGRLAGVRKDALPARGGDNSTHRENLDGGVGQFHDGIGEQTQVEHASQAHI